MKTKICTKCKMELPATMEYFRKDKRNRNGLQSWCRNCENSYNKQRCNEQKQYNKMYYQTISGYLRHVYKNMEQRCTNLARHNYHRYGGRGIENKFRSSQELVDYVVGELQIDPRNLQIDHINNDGHYEPGNIRFITAKENINNKGRACKI